MQMSFDINESNYSFLEGRNIEYYGFSNIKYSDTFENNSDMK